MQTTRPLLITATCGYCQTKTTLTIATLSLSPEQHVECSVCGGDLGTIDNIMVAEGPRPGGPLGDDGPADGVHEA